MSSKLYRVIKDGRTFDWTRTIGASQAAAAVGLSPWDSPWKLGAVKRGLVNREPTRAMSWGLNLEDAINKAYEAETGYKVRLRQRRYHSTVWPWATATIDGRVNPTRLVEGKTSRYNDWNGDVPVHYQVQCQHQMAVTGAVVVDMPVLFAGSDFQVFTVERDEQAIKDLMEQEQEWLRMFELDPDSLSKSLDDFGLAWPISKDVQVEASSEALYWVQQLNNCKETIKTLEAGNKLLLGQLKEFMRDAERLVDAQGKTLATWKTSKPVVRLDLDKLRDERPEIAAEYSRACDPTRPLLVK